MKAKKIISLLITLCMTVIIPIFSLTVKAADAAGAQVKIGDAASVYLTLEDAFGNVPDNGTADIKLFSDMTVSNIISVSSGQTIILDLNGHSLTGHHEVFENIGTLVLTDTSISKSGKLYTNDILPGNIVNDNGSINLTFNQMSSHNRTAFNSAYRENQTISNSTENNLTDSKESLSFFIAAVILIAGIVEYRYIKITL